MSEDERYQKILQTLESIQEHLKDRDANYWDVPISDNQAIAIDYRQRRYLFAWTSANLTFTSGDLGTFTLPSARWVPIGFKPGTLILTSGQGTTAAIIRFCATDFPLITAEAYSKLVAYSNSNASVPSGAANTVIKAAAGNLASVVVTTTGTGAGNVQIFDNATTNSGTVLFAFPANATAGTSYTVLGTALAGMTAQNVANGPVFTVFYA